MDENTAKISVGAITDDNRKGIGAGFVDETSKAPGEGTSGINEIPKPYEEEYIDFVGTRYDKSVSDAIKQHLAHQITNDQLILLLHSAVLEYNAGIREHVDAAKKQEEEEAALAEFDANLREQRRIIKILNDRKKERIKELKEARRQEKLQQQLDREKARGERLQGQIDKLESNNHGIAR